jgi:glycine cleavage system aminomethyltransferase T/glycine/D-amino acid oxidase-like deaminating enzyme
MKSHARAVIIGGGIAGCSVAYHLTKLGWRDVVLVEKGELTSGSTWHSVGNTPMFTSSLAGLRLLKYSVELYLSLEQETGQSIGFHRVGSLRLATNQDLVDWYKSIAGIAKTADVPFDIISVKEAKKLCPFISVEGVLCASYLPGDGYADASAITQALAKGARDRGAEIVRSNRVLAIHQKANGEWDIVTEQGTVTAEVVVNAAGQWGREIGRMVGVELPIVPLPHQYLVTDRLEELESFPKDFPIVRDPERGFYVRQEMDGLLFGIFEPRPKPWAVDGIPPDFSQQLLPRDVAKMEETLTAAVERVPLLETAPIKKTVNGPEGYTPDGRCLMGEVPRRRNFFVLAGFSNFGIANAGGAGKYTAEWIIEGQPSDYLWDLDVRRYGPHAASKRFLIEKSCETYEKDYAVSYPNEERPAGRPLKTSPIYDRLRVQGAVFGARGGWEQPLWFAPEGVAPVDDLTFRLPKWMKHVGEECRAVRERVGVLDETSLGKLEVSGPGAAAFLDRLCTSRVSSDAGRVTASLMLNEWGGIECDVVIACLGSDRYLVFCDAALVTRCWSWMERQLPKDGSVSLHDVTGEFACLSLSGPRSRDVLRQVSDDDVSHDALPPMSFKEILVGNAPVRAVRISRIGELGWDLLHPPDYQRHVYDRLMAAGKETGIVNYGYRAVESMRLEKGYPVWGVDLSPKTTPFDAGLGDRVDLDQGDFLGREALVRQKQDGVERVLTRLIVEGISVVPHGGDPVWSDGKIIGNVTSGNYGHVLQKPLAMAYLPVRSAQPGAALEVQTLSERYPAAVVTVPAYDPSGAKIGA